MKAKFSFHKAGQGLFYGGRIWDYQEEKTTTVVYDCGTSSFINGNKSALTNEINNFKHLNYPLKNDNSNEIEIELLFISHLDYDHVSGLGQLFENFKVKNIILPYLEIRERTFSLLSFPDDIDPTYSLSLDDYISFIESPTDFIKEKSEGTKLFFIKPNKNNEYEGYASNNNNLGYIYRRGTRITEEGLGEESNVFDNNLQFFIQNKWEFTTYVQGVNEGVVNKLHEGLKSLLKIKDDLTIDDLKQLLTSKRKKAREYYLKHIGEINAHGLVLLHGPINAEYLHTHIDSSSELNDRHHDFGYRNKNHDSFFENKNNLTLKTLLFGDTSLRDNNESKINFPDKFKDKLTAVHVVQVPHHGASKNWCFEEFKLLNIGSDINRWENEVVSVCNFGYGNTYGHPSHNVLNDLRATIFLNTQFSRLNIKYCCIIHKTS